MHVATRSLPYSRPGSGEDETVTRELGSELSGRPQYPGTMVVLADDDEPTREASTLPDQNVEELAPDDVTLVADKSSSSIDLRLVRRPLGALPPPSTPPPRDLPRATAPPRRHGFTAPMPFGRPATLSPLRVVAPPASSARWTVPESSAPVARRRPETLPANRLASPDLGPRGGALPRVLVGGPAPLPPLPSLPPLPPAPIDLGEATDLLPASPSMQQPASSPPPPAVAAPTPAPMPVAPSAPPVAAPVHASLPAATPSMVVQQGSLPAGHATLPPSMAAHVTSFPRPPSPDPNALGYLPEPPVAAPSYALPRSGPSRAAKLGAICGAASLVLSLGVGVLSLLPRHGTLRVELETNRRAAAEKAEVFIDGQKVCDVAPCIVSDLSPGLKTIRVIGPGIPGGSAVVTATVEAGRERLAMVPLGNEGAAPSAGGAGELHVAAGSQQGVRVLVDGVDHGQLPLDMKDVPAGVHRLRFEAGDRYAPLERQVDVAAGRSVDLGVVRLKLLKGRITIDDAPAGARVLLVRNTPPSSERVLSGPWPTTVDVEAVSWQIIAAKKGQGEVTEEVSFEDGQADKHVRLELSGTADPSSNTVASAPAAAPIAVAAREPAPRAPSRSAPREAPPPAAPAPPPAPSPPPRAAEPERPAPVSASGTGTLSMNSLPLSKVLIDGRPLGSTPKVDVPVPAGTHTVTFVHPDLGKKSVTVTVKAGESASASVRFRKD
jgi:serine/threonine-protein kinase